MRITATLEVIEIRQKKGFTDLVSLEEIISEEDATGSSHGGLEEGILGVYANGCAIGQRVTLTLTASTAAEVVKAHDAILAEEGDERE